MKRVLLYLIALLFMTSTAYAGTWNWSNSSYSMGTYVPVSGFFMEGIQSGGPTGAIYTSTVYFTLDSYNVSSISNYNSGYGTGGTCYGNNAYLTLDITAVPDAWDLEIDAYVVYSNLPNPKYDIESDLFSDPDHEESETVALGSVSATTYYMVTYWADERDGDANDGGDIQAQFAMSKLGLSDYNNCVTANGVQIINPYGNNLGDY